MKVIKVSYTRLLALPKYENKRIGIEMEVEAGEDATAILAAAKKWVHDELGIGPTPSEVKKAKEVLKEAGQLF